MNTVKSLRDFKDAISRRKFLEKQLKVKLENISHFSFTEEQVNGRNIENLIGATQIPLGIAGPLKISNVKFQMSNVYIPLATTEGALVASISRGCKAVTEAGGAIVEVENVGSQWLEKQILKLLSFLQIQVKQQVLLKKLAQMQCMIVGV